MKKVLCVILAVITLLSIASVPVSAASYPTNYTSYTTPSSIDFAYWNGSKVVKASWTTKSEVKWMQTALNYCIKNKGLNASYLTVDGSFGPASKKATLAFQKKYGLIQDGSFGPLTIIKMKSVLTAKTNSTTTTSGSSKTLSIDWSLIKKTGKQSVSGPCLCYAFAYCRDILDGKQHSWTEYSLEYLKSKGRYSYTASCSKAGYTKKYASSTTDVYKVLYNNINQGKPVVINVTGGRSTGCHYVAVVGYVNVTNTSKLSASNFLIIDSAGSGGYTTENLGGLGYSLLKSDGKYKYYVD